MKILLLGDSIRCGYCAFVREKLSGRAEVYFPAENGRFAQYTLRQLQDWKGELGLREDVDVVHWNNGLWDCGHLGHGASLESTGGTDAAGDKQTVVYEEETLTPPDIYAYMIRRVYRRIHTLFPRAKVIFACTTPVIEEKAPPILMRYNSEIEHFNQVARQALQEFPVLFNDLYAFSKENLQDCYADWVHYNEKGSRLLADRIGNFIMNAAKNQQ